MRIHKLLSDQGVASRRGAERLIEEGRVTVNGRPAVIGQDVNPARDIVHIDGERVAFAKKAARYYILLNKPRGYVTTLSDELGRRCVAELLSEELHIPMTDVTKCGGHSYLLTGTILDALKEEK